MLFKKPVSPIRNEIRLDCDEWPKNNESWAEFMVRKDCEGQASPNAATILACLIILPFVSWMLVKALDKAFS